MRALICSLIMVSALLWGPDSYGQTIEKTRTEKKTFKVNPDMEIEIMNKYGDVHLVPWEKDSIRFEINLVVKGTKDTKVDKSFDYIEFDFKSTEYYIIVQTLFAGKSTFWSDVSDLTGAIFNSSTKTKIDYTVYMPNTVKLKIMNKYGNIYTTDHRGELEIDLSNGDLKANDLSGKTSITSEFGNVNVKVIKDAKLTISYGELHLDQGGQLIIESKSTKFYIDDVDKIEFNSKRDKFYLENIGQVDGYTDFSLIEIDQLKKSLNLTTKYGDLEVKSFADGTKSLNVNSQDTDITLHFPDEKKYKMDILVNGDTEVLYSAEIKNITSKDLEGSEKLIQVDCTVGTSKTKVVPIKIDSRGGSLSLKLK